MKSPCARDCPGRAPDCHGSCEKYQEYRRELDEINAEKYRQRLADLYAYDAMEKRARRRKIHKPKWGSKDG